MKKNQIIKKVTSLRWDFWLERRFDSPYVVYLFLEAATRAAFTKIDIKGEYPSVIYEKNIWFTNEGMRKEAGKIAEQFLKRKNISNIVKECELNYKKSKKEFKKIINEKLTLEKKYSFVYEILLRTAAYIWVTHCCEEYYEPLIREKACIFFKDEQKSNDFISSISFPSKKNAHTVMEEWLVKGVDPVKIHKRFSWIKSRFAFRQGYTLEEIKQLQEQLKIKKINKLKQKKEKIKIPSELKPLVKELQELIYFRLMRIDAVYELFFLAQPLFDEIAKELNIEGIKYYFPQDLFKPKLTKAPEEYAAIKYYDHVIFTKPILNYQINKTAIIKGMAAYQGYAKGKAKIVQSVKDLDKVKEGDIMITHMTMPPYLPAMHRAAAFVTDEGGITCHAAIVAREMKKPCIIGTKTATKVFKDNDLVEVDANKGTVKKL
ncbi:hypothetical protein HYY69_03945 [Candidatus Woesearchaeota archaeon]|nr:hypothetical protein [Candidatus Woesearchaeota archaeon]